MDEPRTVDITPAGMQTPEGIQRVNEAQKWLENAQNNCARLLGDMVDEGGDFNDHKSEARDAVKRWKEATETFLRAVCGR